VRKHRPEKVKRVGYNSKGMDVGDKGKLCIGLNPFGKSSVTPPQPLPAKLNTAASLKYINAACRH